MKILIQRDSYDKFLVSKTQNVNFIFTQQTLSYIRGRGFVCFKVILLKEINDEVLILQSVIYLIMTDKQQQLK